MIRDLGHDLLRICKARRVVALSCPFLIFAAYFVFAYLGYPLIALLAVVVLSFITYGTGGTQAVPRVLTR